MPSSTSSSEPVHEYWVQPLPERSVPQVAWRTVVAIALTLFVAALAVWEWRMRTLELKAGDLGAARGAWASERRRIGAEDVPLAIVGSSRALFGTDLDVFTQVAGVRPVQLALQGSSTSVFFAELAADPNFRGLLVVDVTPGNFFRSGGGPYDDALDFYRNQSLSQRSDHWLEQQLQKHFAYMDADYRLMKLIERETHLPERQGVAGPYGTVWKVAETYQGRQTYTWSRLQHDERLRAHAVAVWHAGMQRGPPPTPEDFDRVIAQAKQSVEAIRARGGDVVFFRPPSSGELARIENERFPRAQAWDRLLRETQTTGFHFADHPETRDLTCVEESHLSRADAAVFTRAYAAFVRSALVGRSAVAQSP